MGKVGRGLIRGVFFSNERTNIGSICVCFLLFLSMLPYIYLHSFSVISWTSTQSMNFVFVLTCTILINVHENWHGYNPWMGFNLLTASSTLD